MAWKFLKFSLLRTWFIYFFLVLVWLVKLRAALRGNGVLFLDKGRSGRPLGVNWLSEIPEMIVRGCALAGVYLFLAALSYLRSFLSCWDPLVSADAGLSSHSDVSSSGSPKVKEELKAWGSCDACHVRTPLGHTAVLSTEAHCHLMLSR